MITTNHSHNQYLCQNNHKSDQLSQESQIRPIMKNRKNQINQGSKDDLFQNHTFSGGRVACAVRHRKEKGRLREFVGGQCGRVDELHVVRHMKENEGLRESKGGRGGRVNELHMVEYEP